MFQGKNTLSEIYEKALEEINQQTIPALIEQNKNKVLIDLLERYKNRLQIQVVLFKESKWNNEPLPMAVFFLGQIAGFEVFYKEKKFFIRKSRSGISPITVEETSSAQINRKEILELLEKAIGRTTLPYPLVPESFCLFSVEVQWNDYGLEDAWQLEIYAFRSAYFYGGIEDFRKTLSERKHKNAFRNFQIYRDNEWKRVKTQNIHTNKLQELIFKDELFYTKFIL